MIEKRGNYWRPEFPDAKLTGVLTIDDESDIKLDLDGSFEDMTTTFALDTRYPVIHGLTSDGSVSLLNAMHVGVAFSSSGYLRQQLWVDHAVLGAHVGSDEAFSQMRVECEHLTDWHRRTGVHFAAEPPGNPERWRATYVWPVEKEAVLRDGSIIQLAFEHSVQSGLGTFLVEEVSSFRIRPSSPAKPWSLFGDYAARLRDLVSIATHTPAAVGRVVVSSANHGHSMPDGGFRELELELLGRFVQPAAAERTTSNATPDRQLFLPDDYPGGLKALIPAWFELYERAREALDLYLGFVYQPAYWFPSRVATLAQALEAYHRLMLAQPARDSVSVTRVAAILDACPAEHRMWLEPRLAYAHEPPLAKRLRQLIQRLRPLTLEAFADTRAFVEGLTDARNQHAHPGDRTRPGAVDTEKLYVVQLQARWLLLANVLLDLGLDPSKVGELLHRNSDFAALTAKLAGKKRHR